MSLLWRFAFAAKKGAVYAFFLLVFDVLVLGLYSVILGRSMLHFFTLATLLESAALFLMGGALDVGGSLSFHKLMDHVSKTETEWSAESHRRAQSSAAFLIVAGAILFVLSFALAYPLN